MFNNTKIKAIFIVFIAMLILGNSACGITSEPQIKDIVITMQDLEENEQTNSERITEICNDLYANAAEERTLTYLETVRGIVNRFGEAGYVAVDSQNQIDMTNPEQVIDFYDKAISNDVAQIIIIEVSYAGGFAKYDLQSADGNIDISRCYYKYDNGNMIKTETSTYQAENFVYTEEGYLMFSGRYFSAEMYVSTLSETEEYAAFRVQPLDEKCRELNRQYLTPIGYERNNMFIIDWNENDFDELDFYDMYDILYPKLNTQPFPYVADDNSEVSVVYQIPQNDFENVIMSYFNIDSDTLKSKTTYYSGTSTYEYKPRGFYDAEYPEYPYSEVVDYTYNRDGTITLLANVVFPYANISKVYSHEVVVRPLDNGGMQYVSNKIIPSDNNYEVTWHTPRGSQGVTEESLTWLLPQISESIFTEEEQEQLQRQALLAAEEVKDVYKTVYSSNNKDFSSIICKEIVALLGKAGFVSVTDNCNMENPEKIEKFYSDYSNDIESMVTVFDVNQDGLIGSITFLYRNERVQTYYVGIGWKEDGTPQLRDTLVSNVNEINLTEKGYFIYQYETVLIHANLREYWRTKPLSDKCRELTEEYISKLSYVNYNMLVINWDSGNVEDILMPCMFEDIYRIYTGCNLQLESDRIQADIYEEIMLTYFPVTVEQLRTNCGYDENTNSYQYEMIYATQYPPFGEVVDYKENDNGTITLIVDAVWADYNSDCAFTNKIVVEPFNDGTFRYLSNSIEQKEMELPLIARE